MKEFQFEEAEPFLAFINANREHFIGHEIKELFTQYWIPRTEDISSDEPVVFVMDDCCIVVDFFFPSDITISIGTREEIQEDTSLSSVMNTKKAVHDYYGCELDWGVKKEDIEGCKIIGVELERFTEWPDMEIIQRPKIGDYFSTVRISLSSGKTLCLSGDSSIADGYVLLWCE